MKVASGLLLALAAGCALPPVDPFQRGRWSLEQRDLANALQSFHRVPPAHRDALEAAQFAANVEIEMRWCHEQLALAISQRTAGSDHEALATLHRVQQRWPQAPGLVPMLRATAARLAAAGVPAANQVAAGAVPPMPSPPRPPVAVAVGAVPAVEVAIHDRAIELPRAEVPERAAVMPERAAELPPRAAELPPPDAPVPSAVAVAAVEPGPAAGLSTGLATGLAADQVTQRLAEGELRLSRGDREGAIADLHDLARRFPHEARVRLRLARLLHQRAMLRYGDGQLPQAIADWRQVVTLDPEHEQARACLQSAQGELGVR